MINKRAAAGGFKNAAGFSIGLEPECVAIAEVGQQRNIQAFGTDAETAKHAARLARAGAGEQLATVVGKGQIRRHHATLAWLACFTIAHGPSQIRHP